MVPHRGPLTMAAEMEG